MLEMVIVISISFGEIIPWENSAPALFSLSVNWLKSFQFLIFSWRNWGRLRRSKTCSYSKCIHPSHWRVPKRATSRCCKLKVKKLHLLSKTKWLIRSFLSAWVEKIKNLYHSTWLSCGRCHKIGRPLFY